MPLASSRFNCHIFRKLCDMWRLHETIFPLQGQKIVIHIRRRLPAALGRGLDPRLARLAFVHPLWAGRRFPCLASCSPLTNKQGQAQVEYVAQCTNIIGRFVVSCQFHSP